VAVNYKLKLLLCGSASSGKSNIIKKHVKASFQAEYKLTVGVDILTKDVTLDNGEVATLSIWDIGSQKRFEFSRTMFYKGASAAIIVRNLSIDLGEEDLHVWVDEIRQFVGSIPIVVIGNPAGLPVDDPELVRGEAIVRQQAGEFELAYYPEEAFDEAIAELAGQMAGTGPR